jgi:hypothetical protein
MSRRTTGAIFCMIAAILFATRHLTAAIFGSNLTTWNGELFQAMLEYTGRPLTILSVISLVIGIIYLVLSEVLE